MNSLRQTNKNLEGIVPYDPKYLPARTMLSANENPQDVPSEVRDRIRSALAGVSFNRYPDPLANELRDEIAGAYGLARDNVLVGNGGDELLYNIALAWGGEGRTALDLPPTFSTYAASARLVGTTVDTIDRVLNSEGGECSWSIDEQAVLSRVEKGDVDYAVICSPNNPTGDVAGQGFVERLLGTTDALVVVDEAYGEFSGETVVGLVQRHENLAVLRTFSKAYRLAGVRVGYLLASERAVSELCKVRQPYSVDAVSQAVALECWRGRDAFEPGTRAIVKERERMFAALAALTGVEVFPSCANFLLFRVKGASSAWQRLYESGVLVRDFSSSPLTQDCLRVSVGTAEENDAFLSALARAVGAET